MLKNQRFILVLLICAALAILISGRAGSQSDKEQEASEKAQTENTNTFLKNKIEEAQSIADTLRLDHPTKLHGKWNYFQGLGVHPTFWTAVDWVPDSAQRNQKTHHLIQHKSGWDLLFPVPSKGYVLTYPLVRFLKGSFHKLNNISPLQNIEFEFSKTAKNHLILDGTTYISYYGSTKTAYGKWFLAGGLILILLAYILAYYTSLVAAIIIACSATLLRYSIFKGWIHGGLKQWVIFDPSIFASSENLPSLGDLLLHIYVGLMLTLTIIKLAKSSTLVNKYLAGSAIFVFGLTAFFGSGMMHDLFKSLILNSNISFDVTNLGSISIFTLVAAVLMAILFWLYFLVIDVGVHLLKQRNLPSMIAIGLLILSSIGFTVFQSVDASRSLGGLFPSILFNVACLCLRCVGSRIPKIYGYLSFVGLVSIFVTTTIYQNQSEREVEYLNLYANKLVTNKDLEAEYMFRNMENELAEEFLQPEDFTAFDKKKEFFEKRLRRLYFSGYLDRYNMLVMSFDSLGTNINSSTLYSFDQLNDIYNNSTFSTISNHFYQVKNSQIFNGYLAKFENCDITGHYGSIFILLEPKFIQSSYEYAALVQKKKERSVFDIDDYSYAIYNRGTLMHQKGSFSYSLHIDTTRTLSEKSFFNEGGYRHFISKHPGGANVLLSTIDNLSLRALSTFSFTFILFTILLLLGGLVWFVGWQILLRYFKTFKHGNSDQYHAHQFTFLSRMSTLGIEQVYLSTRIRFAMVGLVFVGLLISIYVTIQFIRINNFSRAETDLMYRIREIANQLQNEVNLDLKLKDEESEQLIVNEIGDLYKVEVTLFDQSGYMLASSVESLYEAGVIAPYMNPDAKRQMSAQNASQLIHNERIRNLTYISGYIPIFNSNRQVIAYLNLPYFQRRNELDKEISSYTVTFVNLYLFLMLLAITLAYFVSKRISKPLQLIRDKMSTTGLGIKTELIEWKRNDEIGRLVQQYNKMVLQLAESAQKLSESEREGAWKEMARQVAHEIKNPLTPMKLNIQHLQRAWADDSDKLESTFERVTNVLITQIDSLSKLASEFSSFAQMPVNNFEITNITEILYNTITLFEKSENVLFQYSIQWPNVNIHADVDQVGRAFNNVIKNAIQSIPEERHGQIELSLIHQIAQQKVLVKIKDNGKGIPTDELKKIFVPNFSTKNSGMGLGLAITRKMIEAAGGRIWFESTVDVGTTFFLEWPVAKEGQDLET